MTVVSLWFTVAQTGGALVWPNWSGKIGKNRGNVSHMMNHATGKSADKHLGFGMNRDIKTLKSWRVNSGDLLFKWGQNDLTAACLTQSPHLNSGPFKSKISH